MMNNLLLGICFIIAASILGSSFEAGKKYDNINKMTIQVKGFASKDIVSDLGTWSGNFNVTNPDLKQAFSDIQIIKSKVLTFFNNMGVETNKIQFSAINTETLYEQVKADYGYVPSNTVIGYKLNQMISIELADVKKIEEISKLSTNLIEQGINFDSHSPQYFYTKIEELKLEMLANSATDAKNRAEKLADNTDAEVGNLISASQGVFQITSKNSQEISSYGMYDTYSIDKTISAVITAEFEVK